nr:nucleotide-binding alpha-beta plait domain-containing protein [Tanacetum cinerariifolium]
MKECPNMVLDETCLNHEDFSLCLLGKVKEFASLTNLKVVLGKEGYANIELKYMGGFWVMIVFQDDETKKGLYGWTLRALHVSGASRWGTLLNGEELEEEGYHSNRICICTNLKTVVFDSFKMVYRGMTCWVRAIEVPGWVPNFEEDGEEGYDVNDGSHEDDMYAGVSKNLKDVKGESDMKEFPETNFEEVLDKSIFEGNSVRQNDVHSEDPFGIYEGDVPVEMVDNWSDENRVNDGQKDGAELADLNGVIDKGEGSDADGHRRREVVRLIQEVKKVDAMEVAQKAKIKWSIEGDENSKYYH